MSSPNVREFGKCLVFYGYDKLTNSPKLSMEEFVLPNRNSELAKGQVLLKISLATVCGSDLHTLRGRRKEPVPCVLGHEGYGKAIISNRPDVTIGDIVTFTICDVCSKCEPCNSRLEQKCTNLSKYGHSVYDSVDSEYVLGTRKPVLGFAFSAQSIVPMGCYSTHILLSEGTTIVNLTSDPHHQDEKEIGDYLMKSIQKSVTSISLMNLWPTFNCAFATMVHGMEKLKMNLTFNETVDSKNGIRKSALILGGGLLGLYGIMLLKHHFGEHLDVHCCDIDPNKRDIITNLGATFILGKAGDVGNGYHIIIEVCGVKQALMDNLHLLKPGGILLLVGLCHPNSALDITAEKIIRNCWTIIGIYNYRAEHLKEAVSLASTSDYFFRALNLIKGCVSEPISLSDLQKRLEDEDSESFFRKFQRVVVDPSK